MTNRISVSNPTQPVISVTDEGGVLVTVNYQNSTGGGGGTGDVVGPASSTDNAIARYDGTTGKLIQDSGITIADGATGTLAGSNSGDVTLGASVTDVLAVTGQSISGVDQGADRIVFWDESANKLTALTAGSGLSISGTTITATATGDVVGPASSTDNALVRFDSTTGKLVQNGQITESDTGDLAAINSLAFDTTPTGAIAAQGEVMWNSDEETLDIQLNSFAQHVGEHVLYHVKNSTGSTIAKGVPVMFAGTNGASGKLLVQPWNGTGPSTYFMGLLAEELVDTEEGFVIAFGKLRGIQTNGGNYGETWADGEIIYVGTTTGSLTKTQPAAPNPHIQVCAVVNAHASNGTLFIRPTLGSNIKDDEGVTITSLSSGQLLVANNAGTVFENKSVSGDATLANTGALTLATVNSNVGSFGSATAAPAVTVNAKGLVTAVSTNTITPAVGSITGLGTNVAASLANSMSASGTLAILAANTFTATQTITPAANTNALAVSGYSLTGSNASALLNLAGTWNTSGTPSAIFCNITDTASNASSLLLQLQTGGTNRAVITKTGLTTLGSSAIGGAGTVLNLTSSFGTAVLSVGGGGQLNVGGGVAASGTISASVYALGLLEMQADANYEIGFRRGTNATKLSAYNTFTSSTNFERFCVDWKATANTCRVGTEKGSGGGTARAMNLMTDATARAVFEATTFNTTLLASAGSYGSGSGVLFLGNATTAPTTDPTGGGILYVEASSLKFRGESGGNNTLAILAANTFTGAQTLSANGAASTPALSITGTIFSGGSGSTNTPQVLIQPSSGVTANTGWNTSGTALGVVLPVTGTLANFLHFRRDNIPYLSINGTGRATGFEVAAVGGSGLQAYTTQANAHQELVANRTVLLGEASTGLRMSAAYYIGWSSSAAGAGDAFNNNDLIIRRDAAGILAQRNGTNAQSLRVYNTFTSATNYELASIGWATNILSIGTEKGSGGGTARAMQLVTDGTSRVNIGAAGEIGLYGVTAVARATTAGAAATFVTNTSGILNDTATFDGYTIGQVVKALRNVGILT